MIKGETLATGARDTCTECGETPVLQVLYSPAGHYIGTHCKCGPFSRESDYFPNRDAAEEALKQWNQGNRIGSRE